jgi:hypothetical protein
MSDLMPWDRAAPIVLSVESAVSEAECLELFRLARGLGWRGDASDQEAVDSPTRIVEVGTYKGRSLAALRLGSSSATEVHAVDQWEDVVGVGGPIPGRAAHRALSAFVDAHRALFPEANTFFHRGDSVAIAAGWVETEGPIDLLFIDGDHSEWGVWRDWKAWSPSLAYGAVVVWHDYGRGAPFAVRDVVDELVQDGKLWVVRQVDSMLVTRRPHLPF